MANADNGSGNPVYLSAKEAAAELGVSLATLYAYVSRGLVRSETIGNARTKRYRADDVRTLQSRKRPAPESDKARSKPLQWGAPILDSKIALITDKSVYYRGRDATVLAEEATLESVATLLWDATRNPFAEAKTGLGSEVLERYREILEPLGPLERALTVLPTLAERDPSAFVMDGAPALKAGARLMRVMSAAIVGTKVSDTPIHQQLAEVWAPDDVIASGDVLRRALVLCADHELNPSTFTVRCAASTGASLYYAVIAGLCALKGPRHGGMTARVYSFLEVLEARDMEEELVSRLTRGETIPGFGHPLYEDHDPRAEAILAALRTSPKFVTYAKEIDRLSARVTELTGRNPTIDVALAAIARGLGQKADAALAIFALGRTAGWIAHALEQAKSRQFIRPRARYVGQPAP